MPHRHPHHPLPEPLDVDGVGVVTVGTALWAVAAVVLAIAWPELDRRGDTWWLWTALVGFGLGLIGMSIARRRRTRLRSGHAPSPVAGSGA
jgi:hypothetical protein